MITRSLKLLISAVVHFVTVPSARRSNAASGHCTVLYYHAVTASQIPAFARQMAELTRRATVISAAAPELARPGSRTVAVTFDDGFRSFRDHALPVMTAAGIPSVVFVPSGNLGRVPAWAMEGLEDAAEAIMTAEEVRTLPGDLVTVGSHSVTHPRLPEIEDPAAVSELADSKVALAAITGRPVELFSFPYGRWTPDLVERCRELGYRRLFTSLPVPLRGGQDSFVVGRVAVGPDDWEWEFRLKVLGAYRWVPAASRLKRRLRRRG